MTEIQIETELGRIIETVRDNDHLTHWVRDRPDHIILNVEYDTDFSTYDADQIMKDLIKKYDFVIEYHDGVRVFRAFNRSLQALE
jgi:hypothetical protein